MNSLGMCCAITTGTGSRARPSNNCDSAFGPPEEEGEEGELLIEVSACGMNNTDIKVREGSYGAEDDPNAVSTWRARAGEESTLQFPRIQGADTVGHIVAVGDGVSEARVGERIMVDFCIYNRPEGDDSLRDIDYYGHGRDGGFAEYMVVEDGNAIKVESAMDDAELATFSCAYQTGEHMIERAGLAAGETVLITGAAGGVGSGIIQLARARGAIPYAVTSKGKEQVLKDLGAEATIPRQDFQGPNGTDEQAFIDRVEQAMAGREVDAEVVHLDGAVEISIRLGVADAIADVVQTGRTLDQAGLKTVGEPILHSEAVLVGREEKMSENGQVRLFMDRLRGILVARDYVMIEYDIPEAVLDEACAVTPGIESPTIAPLTKPGWKAVKSMTRSRDVNPIIDQLVDLGAKGIIVSDIRTCRI